MAANRVLYFYLLLVSFFFFVLFDVYLFPLLLLFLLLLPVFSMLLALPVCRAVRCRMDVEDEIVPKGRCAVRLSVENASFLPCACARIQLNFANALGRTEDSYASETRETVQLALNAHKKVVLRPALLRAECGRTDFTVRRVEVCDMLGLISLRVPEKNIKSDVESVFVLPEPQTRTVMIEDTSDIGLDSATYSKEKPGGDPAEIFQLREYREGDSLHSVHWKLSGRMRKLIVREFGLPLNPSLHFLIELTEHASPDAAEGMLGAALAFSEYLLSRETVHCLSFINDDGALETCTVTNEDQLAEALHSLLSLRGRKPWSALKSFAVQAEAPAKTHLIYLVAGAHWKSEIDADALRALALLIDENITSRITLMPDACSPAAAEALSSLGCEIQLLDGRIPNLAPEEDE